MSCGMIMVLYEKIIIFLNSFSSFSALETNAHTENNVVK